MGMMGGDVTKDDLIRVHERLDQETEKRAEIDKRLAVVIELQASSARAVDRLADAVQSSMHKTPCTTAQELNRQVAAHLSEHDQCKKTVEIKREKTVGEWRSFAFNTAARIITWLFIALAGGWLMHIGWSIKP